MIFRELMEHLNRQKEEARRKEACRNIGTGVAIGAVLGLAAGILFAPQSGKDTRKAIADKTVDTAGQVKDAVTHYAGELKELAHEAQAAARKGVETAKESVQDLVAKVKQEADHVESLVEDARQEAGEKIAEVAEKVKPK